MLRSLLPSDRAAAAAYLLAVRTGTFPRKLMRQVQQLVCIGADRYYSFGHTFPVVSGVPSSATLFRLLVRQAGRRFEASGDEDGKLPSRNVTSPRPSGTIAVGHVEDSAPAIHISACPSATVNTH